MARRNASGGGSIRQRPDKTWEARFTYKDEYGQTKRGSIYAKTQKECRQKLTATQKAIDEGTYGKAVKRYTVEAWLNEWLTLYCPDLKPGTIQTYQSRVERDILPYIGKVQLTQLKNQQIQRLMNTLTEGNPNQKPLSAKTVVNVHGILHKALEQAVAAGLIPSNPSDHIKLPKIKKPELKPFTDDSLSAFLNAIKGDEFERIYIVALFTGMRQSEIIGLQWGDIDWERGIIHVSRQRQRNLKQGGYRMVESTKNGKARKVTAAAGVLKILEQQRRQQAEDRLAAGPAWDNPDNFIFTDKQGQPVKHPAVHKHYKKIVASIGMGESRFHDLRHSYAINAIQGGDNIKAISDNLGHYSMAFTMDVYGDTSDAMRKHSQEVDYSTPSVLPVHNTIPPIHGMIPYSEKHESTQ